MPGQNQPADQHVLAGLDKTARGNIGQSCVRPGLQIVDLHQSDSCRIIFPAHNRRVIARRDGRQDR